VFGGTTAIPDSLIDGLSSRMMGSATISSTDRSPRLDEAFFTTLDMSPVFDDTSGVSSAGRVCAMRDDYANARWMFVRGATQSASVDVMLRGRYVRDADGTVRSPTLGSPVCVAAPAGTTGVRAVAVSGPVSGGMTLDTAVARRVGLSASISASAPLSSNGIDSTTDLSEGGTTAWNFSSTPAGVSLSALGTPSSVTSSTLSLTLTRGATTSATTSPDRVAGTFSLLTASGSIQGTIEGEAILVAGFWKIRGRVSFTGGSGPVAAGFGGFVADLAVNSAGTLADDSVVWRLDGLAG
jgi:hypothetical protein